MIRELIDIHCRMGLPLTKATINRDDRIRTCGPFVPNEVRYQAALHPDRLTVEGEVAWNCCCQWIPELLS